ncbi:Septin [Spraguea lophii 42_110]|uniref:Septin n=1 Tax=Spraguea lophii (strain 42_110) TaxID=1358809 RepID=S7W4I9_SPRLO|nr:Septin [Spraguea lophii 42_110]
MFGVVFSMIITIKNSKKKIETTQEVGFAFVPDQIRKKSIENGFYINILVVGRRGLGSSTLINNLFCSPIVDKEREDDITFVKNEIFENDIKLTANISTYHLNNLERIKNYIENKLKEYYDMEQSLIKAKVDNKIHVCLYMIPGDKITKEEIELMKEISQMCNFLPIISKTDSYTEEELRYKKQQVLEIFDENDIRTYSPPNTSEVFNFPLAVIASGQIHNINGNLHRGRMYPWGFIDVEAHDTSDLIALRKILIHSYLDDLINKTNQNFYESYRLKRLERESIDENLKAERIKKIKEEIQNIMSEQNDIKNSENLYKRIGQVSIDER